MKNFSKKFLQNIRNKTSTKITGDSLGFTLIEIVIAISIFSIGVIAVLNLFPKGLRLSQESKELSVATNLAQEKIEEYLAKNYDEIPTGIIEAKSRVDNDPNSQFYAYQRTVESAFIDSDLNDSISNIDFKKIVVTIYWIEKSKEKNIQLIRLLNKR